MTQLAAAPAITKKRPHVKIDAKQNYLDAFTAARGDMRGPTWLTDLRQTAIEAFGRIGMPSPKAEAWRYTKHRAVTSIAFLPVIEGADDNAARDHVGEYGFGNAAAAQIVFVDGAWSEELSNTADLPGIEVIDLLTAAETHAETVQQHLARHAKLDKHPFVALNTAFFRGGAFIKVDSGAKLQKPIHLLFLSTGDGEIVAFPRTLIVAGDEADFSVVETYAGTEGSRYFTCGVTEIVAGEDCIIDHNKLNAESKKAYHVAAMETSIGARTQFADHSCTIGGLMTRNDLNVHMDGEAAGAILNGVVLLDGEQHCDNHTLLDHQHPNCPSHELYKHVLDGRSSGIFKGQIFVAQIAQKTDSKQNSRTLLLSDEAQMNSQPALEIYADDVKCTHGSTTGPLDEGSIFYLNSRGVSTDTARRLLTYAFAADVTRRIKVAPVRQRVEDYMARQHGLPTDFRIQDLAGATEDVVF